MMPPRPDMLLCPDKMKISKHFFVGSAMVIAHWSDAWFDVEYEESNLESI
jgi:hypothetical protein